MVGTLINFAAIVVGGFIGLAFRSKFPNNIRIIVFQAMGLFTLFLGVSMALKMNEILLAIFALILGGITGELLRLETRMNGLGETIKRRIKFGDARFTEGLVTAFLMFCMGSMTILGSLEEGMGNYPRLLMAKSLMDGISAIALTAAFGSGVIFAAIPLLIYQGALTLLARYFGHALPESIVSEISGVGGVLLIGLGLTILEVKAIKVLNLLPALVFIVVLVILFGKYI
ncbi:DUF554 domain-containing protein [Williamwhitmania taraxaci]|uniref:DUF554 domain-containing protein n=1 Tax=Williamwhitmania taraxaci TaxID=1640674 RepID=A0A1G6H4M9_9BACT|nr:DUF554 domain-containing protein [Williamwhitmania taraxaci]SDB89250.1 hypothetical protein SAMN05216323_10077 [Williamwhitmania taraxaci]